MENNIQKQCARGTSTNVFYSKWEEMSSNNKTMELWLNWKQFRLLKLLHIYYILSLLLLWMISYSFKCCYRGRSKWAFIFYWVENVFPEKFLPQKCNIIFFLLNGAKFGIRRQFFSSWIESFFFVDSFEKVQFVSHEIQKKNQWFIRLLSSTRWTYLDCVTSYIFHFLRGLEL